MRLPLLPLPADRRPRRITQMLVGLLGFGVTAGMVILAGLGNDPWDVFHQGLSRTFGLGIGTWGVIISFLLLLTWVPLRQPAGLGTLTNAIIVGVTIDVLLALAHPPHALAARVALLAAGVLGNGVSTGLYIGAALGPGPRDGLSVGIASRGYSMRIVRTGVEATVLLTGFLLGGTVGVGTLAYALAIGPITHVTIPALALDRPEPAPESVPESVPPTRSAARPRTPAR